MKSSTLFTIMVDNLAHKHCTVGGMVGDILVDSQQKHLVAAVGDILLVVHNIVEVVEVDCTLMAGILG
jgi:hypothetical protein